MSNTGNTGCVRPLAAQKINSTVAVFKFPVRSLKRIEWEADQTSGVRNYICTAKFSDLPSFADWLEVNPRCPRIETHVARSIEESATDAPNTFGYRNRGLLLLVRSMHYDQTSSMLTVTMDNQEIHGLADGGTSYWTLRKLLERDVAECPESISPEIRIEIVSNIASEDMGELSIADLCESRNVSNQVRDVSRMNARGEFDEIREVLKGESYNELIAYSEAEWLDDEGKTRKPIDVLDIVSALLCCDAEDFDDDVHPVIAYSGKKRALKFFQDHREGLSMIIPHLPVILNIYDTIHAILPQAWNMKGGKFGRLTDVRRIDEPRTLHFIPDAVVTSNYIIPLSMKLPTLAACRVFLIKDGNAYRWSTDVIHELHHGLLGQKLTSKLASLLTQNSQVDRSRFGKSPHVWDTLYSAAATYAARMKS